MAAFSSAFSSAFSQEIAVIPGPIQGSGGGGRKKKKKRSLYEELEAEGFFDLPEVAEEEPEPQQTTVEQAPQQLARPKKAYTPIEPPVFEVAADAVAVSKLPKRRKGPTAAQIYRKMLEEDDEDIIAILLAS